MPTVKAGVVEYIEVNSYPIHNYCNWLSTMTPMRKVAYRLTGEAPPYMHGRITFPVYLDWLYVVFPGVLIGDVDSAGAANGNARAGLEENYEEFYAAVLAPIDTGAGVLPVEWHKADSTVWTGVVQVAAFDPRDGDPGRMDYSLTLAFPAARLTAP